MRDPNKLFMLAFNAQNEGNHHKAEKLYRRLLKMDPEWDAKKTITYNLGLVLMSLGKYAEAIKFFKKSNGFEFNDENQWNICLCYLNLGKWNKAMNLFPHRYGETRQQGTEVKFPKLPIQQIDDMYDAENKKLLVFNEQGLGDELLFSTQLKALDELVDYAKVQVSKDTIDLLNEIYEFKNLELSCFDSISVDEVEEFDCYTGLGSVFASLYQYGEAVNDQSFYKNPYTDKVGVCWATNRKSPNTHKRSIDPSILKQIDYELVSLQYGEGYGKELGLEDYVPDNCLESWNRMDQLDVVVTVDTLIAHMAGLKGIPTILLINKHLDWRWKYRDQEDDRYSMFYPMVEIVDVNEDLNEIVKEIVG
jgi:tetratricopeptide (TPR) repeat protein